MFSQDYRVPIFDLEWFVGDNMRCGLFGCNKEFDSSMHEFSWS